MQPDFSALDDRLAALGADAYCVHAASEEPNQRYLSEFDAPDPFLSCYRPDGLALLVSGLEYGRARTESRADRVARPADYDREALRETHGPREANHRVAARFLRDTDVDRLAVGDRFPVGLADGLRALGIEVVVDDEDTIEGVRATKTPAEIEHIRAAQRATEAAMAAAESLFAAATPDADGVLVVDGEPLTSERVKRDIEVTLLEAGCGLDDTIVAGGAQAADPHERGYGPLHANEPIIVDIFPQDKTTKYVADMTRSFCVGEPTATAREYYELTARALEAAREAIEPGATGADVHAAACEVYEEAGLPTLRSDPTTEVGFIHGTGHGVGLAVHERPRLSAAGDELEAGHVVTLEPGLYDPDVGGVRIEDLVVVTDEGAETLTDYPIEFVVS